MIGSRIIQFDHATITNLILFMKTLMALAVYLLVSYGCHDAARKNGFLRIIPDTSNSWAGRVTKETYKQTKQLEGKFGLKSLWNGTKGEELRIWDLSYFGPQVLIILNRAQNFNWRVRTILFYHSRSDSILTTYSTPVPAGRIDSLHVDRFWSLASQSDLKKPDRFGCMEGGVILIEIADSSRYKFMWYRCPWINQHKDSAFFYVRQITYKLGMIAAGY